MKNKSKASEVAQIATAVSAIIVGGYGILVLSSPFAIPGLKYIMMAPYLSLVMSILLNRIKASFVLLKANAVFAMIMSMMNLYMGLAIISSGLLTEGLGLILGKKTPWSRRIVTSAYSGVVILTALPISKYLIGGAQFDRITTKWIIIAALLACCLGFVGSLVGEFISKRLTKIIG